SGARIILYAPVAHEAIPDWIASCDVCAVPYRLNDFTKASSPLKAVEYLGAGAPVLSTKVPSLTTFGDSIACVREGDGMSYATALDALQLEARAEHAVARRCSSVQHETWEYKAKVFCALLKTPIFSETLDSAFDPATKTDHLAIASDACA